MSTPVLSSTNKGKVGKAKVTVRKDDIVVNFDDGTTVKNIPPENAPEWLRDGKFIITMDEDNLKIMYANLPNGIYTAKFKEFSRDKDDKIRVKEIEAKSFAKWDRPRHLEFFPLLEIVDNSKYEGCIVTYPLWYVFVEYEGKAAIKGTGQKKVIDFLRVAGYDVLTGEDVMWSEEVLADYEKILKKANKKMAVVISDKGFVTQLESMDED